MFRLTGNVYISYEKISLNQLHMCSDLIKSITHVHSALIIIYINKAVKACKLLRQEECVKILRFVYSGVVSIYNI